MRPNPGHSATVRFRTRRAAYDFYVSLGLSRVIKAALRGHEVVVHFTYDPPEGPDSTSPDADSFCADFVEGGLIVMPDGHDLIVEGHEESYPDRSNWGLGPHGDAETVEVDDCFVTQVGRPVSGTMDPWGADVRFTQRNGWAITNWEFLILQP